jgi:hypothetical protein
MNGAAGRWWETTEGHRFAGEVLQLRIRREIMKFIGDELKAKEEIRSAFGLEDGLAEIHLALLERADMIARVNGNYRSTPIGMAYIKIFNGSMQEQRDESFNGA